jgi:hypothetical protein
MKEKYEQLVNKFVKDFKELNHKLEFKHEGIDFDDDKLHRLELWDYDGYSTLIIANYGSIKSYCNVYMSKESYELIYKFMNDLEALNKECD